MPVVSSENTIHPTKKWRNTEVLRHLSKLIMSETQSERDIIIPRRLALAPAHVPRGCAPAVGACAAGLAPA